jgi:hypothetical protein
MSGIDIPCTQIVEMVTDYLEDTLEPDQRQLFEEHLADCPPAPGTSDRSRSRWPTSARCGIRICPTRHGRSCVARFAASLD